MSIKYETDKDISSEPEIITIKIDPHTLSYSVECQHAYVEDTYIVLREIVHGFETGAVKEAFALEDVESGKPATREQFAAVVAAVKENVDRDLEEEESTYNLGRDLLN